MRLRNSSAQQELRSPWFGPSQREQHARRRSLSGTREGSLNLACGQFGFVLIDQFEKEFFQVGLLMLFGQFLD